MSLDVCFFSLCFLFRLQFINNNNNNKRASSFA